MNLGDVAKKINGKVEGDSSIDITGVSSIEIAKKGHITFAKGKKFLEKLKKSKASAVLVETKEEISMSQIISSNPELAFARLLDYFHPEPRPKPEIHSSVVLGLNVKLGNRVALSPFVSIGDNVRIGDDVVCARPWCHGVLRHWHLVVVLDEVDAHHAVGPVAHV